MKDRPLLAYLLLLALISGAFVLGMKLLGKNGNYLAGFYMLGPALAATITRAFFYKEKFHDARLRPGRARDYVRFWGITLGVVGLSFLMYTLVGAVSWDFTGDSFLSQFQAQMKSMGRDITDLPAGLTPRAMLFLFAAGGLTVLNIPTMVFGFGEEFGWRGFLFPQLGSRWSLRAAFVVGGLIWFAWHLPLMLVLPDARDVSLSWRLINGVVVAVGSIFAFIYFAWVYAKSGTIWVASLAHAVVDNASRSLSYFVRVDHQFAANVALAITMGMIVALLAWKREFRVFGPFLTNDHQA